MSKPATKPVERSFQLSAPVEFTFAQGDGADLPGKFTGVAYSGGRIPSYGAVIDLSTTKIAAKLPLLDSHMRSEIIGVLSEAQIADNKLSVAGELFSDMAGTPAERIGRMAKRGAPYQLSIGIFGFREVFVPAGQSMSVNGKDHAGPCVVLQGGTVREVSVVTLGADPDTSTHFFDQPEPGTGDPTVTLEQLTARVAELTAQVATLTTERDAATARAAELTAANEAAAKAARTAAIAQLAADTGETIPDAEKAVYLGMAQDAFDAMAGRMRAQAKRLNSAGGALFREVATGDAGSQQQAGAKVLSVGTVYANRAKQAQGAVAK